MRCWRFGRSSTVAIYPLSLNHIAGTKFKLVMGYTGSAEAMLAMERGEVEGHSTTWDGVKSRAENHLRNKTINILVQHGIKRHPELPDVLQDLAEEIAIDVHEACVAFDEPDCFYPGVDDGIDHRSQLRRRL